MRRVQKRELKHCENAGLASMSRSWFSRSRRYYGLDRWWASCHHPRKYSRRTSWAHNLCWRRTWPDSQTSRPRAELRMPCPFRTGKYGKNVKVSVQEQQRRWWNMRREKARQRTKTLMPKTPPFLDTWTMRVCAHAWRCDRCAQTNEATKKCACNKWVHVYVRLIWSPTTHNFEMGHDAASCIGCKRFMVLKDYGHHRTFQ